MYGNSPHIMQYNTDNGRLFLCFTDVFLFYSIACFRILHYSLYTVHLFIYSECNCLIILHFCVNVYLSVYEIELY